LARKRPTPGRIISSVADTFNVSDTSILHAARGPGSKNVPRWVAMYLCQEAGGITLQKIAQQFGLQRYGTVSTTIGKLKGEFEDDPPLVGRVERIRQQLAQ
jgi:putative transposase